MEKNENYLENVEKALKSNINILLSTNTKQERSEGPDDTLTNALNEFEESVRKLKMFFTQATILHKITNPSYYEQEELKEMQTELSRKDNMIKEQVKKLARYRAELEVLQEAQVQAISKNL